MSHTILLTILIIISVFAFFIFRNIQNETEKERYSQPIDAVITFVDGSDPIWIENYKRFKASDLQESSNPKDAAVGNRFRSCSELKYCLRSINKFAPWIRTIYLVVSGPSQLPPWLNSNSPTLRVISHKDFIPNDYLPTFNSHVIEAHLHRLPGLSEIFLYFNDDVFLGKPTKPSDFITDKGKMKFFPDGGKGKYASPKGVPNSQDSAHQAMWKNVNRWLDQNYVEEERSLMLHAPAVLSKSLMNDLWNKLSTELDETSRHRFRNMADFGITCALHQYVSLYENLGEKVSPRNGICYSGELTGQDDKDEKVFNDIRKRSWLSFAINDSDPKLSDDTCGKMFDFLESIFPNVHPSKYELEHTSFKSR
jgi:hypothetical protein